MRRAAIGGKKNESIKGNDMQGEKLLKRRRDSTKKSVNFISVITRDVIVNEIKYSLMDVFN